MSFLGLPRTEHYRRISILVLGLMVAGALYLQSLPSGTESAPEAFSCPGPAVTVAVSGDVQHPGLYCLSANSLTMGAIELAVPLRPIRRWVQSPGPDNPLVTGTALFLTVNPSGAAILRVTPLPVPQRVLLGIPLDINQVSATDLEHLPGIGPVLATRIIKFRQKNDGFMRVEQLQDVEGIGDKTYKRLKIYF